MTTNHVLYNTYRHIFSQTFKQIFIFGFVLISTWTMDIFEERCISLYDPQSPFSRILRGTCTNRNERGYPLLCFCDYLLSHIFAVSQQILRHGLHRFQSSQTKTRENIFLNFSCLCLGLNPGHFSPKYSALPSEPSHPRS